MGEYGGRQEGQPSSVGRVSRPAWGDAGGRQEGQPSSMGRVSRPVWGDAGAWAGGEQASSMGGGVRPAHLLVLMPPLCPHRRVSVAAPGPHQADAAVLQVALPRGGLCLLHHPHLPQRPDRLHAVQQKPCELHALLGAGAGAQGAGGRRAREHIPDARAPAPRAPTSGSPCSR